MEFGPEFATLATITGNSKNPKNYFLLTKKQWVLVIALGIIIAIVINFLLIYFGP